MKNIPTIFINPDPDFVRDENFKGTVIAKSYNELQKYIDEYYTTGEIKDMFLPEKINARKKIIYNVIGFDDGMNHIRAGYYLTKTIHNIKKPQKIKINPLYFIRFILVSTGSRFYYKPLFEKLPKFKKTIWIFERFKLKNIEPLKTKYFSFLDDFHKKNDIPNKLNSKEFWSNLMQ